MADTNKETLVQKLTDIADGFRTSRSLTSTLSLGEMAELAAVPIGGGGENKLAQLADKTITEVTAGDLEGATKIGVSAFSECSSLTSVTIPDSVTSIGESAFKECSSLTSVTIGNSVTSLGNYAFYYCTSLTSVTIGNSVTSIGDYAFYHCSKLASVTIPNSVTTMKFAVFQSCSRLTNITIPDSVTSIEGAALKIGSSDNKATITFLSTTPPTITTSTFYASYLNKIIVPAGSGEAYKSATNWANFADYIEEATE